jgi:hypothetical protein
VFLAPKGRDNRKKGCLVKAIPIIIIVLMISFYGCTTCRVTSVEDANTYIEKGYRARIAIYRTGMDGLLWGGFSMDAPRTGPGIY